MPQLSSSSRFQRAPRWLTAVPLLVALAACTSVVPIKEVTADRDAYMRNRFGANLLDPNVVRKLPRSDAGAGPATLALTYRAQSAYADGRSASWVSKVTYTQLGNGLLQSFTDQSNNDISFSLNYNLSFQGLLDLRWQAVPLGGASSGPLFVVKEITRADALPRAVGDEFVIEFSTAAEGQIANYLPVRKSCKALLEVAASTLHPRLTGRALDLECTLSANNAVRSRSHWLLLKDYGFAFETEFTSSERRMRRRVESVTS